MPLIPLILFRRHGGRDLFPQLGMAPATASGAIVSVILLALGTLLGSPARADLTGKWRVEYDAFNEEFVDVTDVAGAVSLTLTESNLNPGTPIPFTGTLSGSTLSLTGTGCGPPCTIQATVTLGEGYFDGKLDEGFLPGLVHRVLANRCECFDGNTTDGDGCDATCRVEPCFTCTGMPSSCSPTPDGGSCSDGSPCTTAETCTAGVCEGTPVSPCVDLSGLWDTLTVSEFGPDERVLRIEQHDAFVLFRDLIFGTAEHFGTIDPVTGSFSLLMPQLGGFCTADNPLSGTAALDGQTYDASGTFGDSNPGCVGFGYTQTGTRQCPGEGCLPPPVAPAVAPVGGVALGALLVLATWILRPASVRRPPRSGTHHG